MSNLIKVLLVEDDPDQLFLFQQVFNVMGLLTIPATSIAEAMKMVSIDRPDIVLLDVMLHHENGLDIMEKLKNDASTKDIPIVVFTNTNKQEYRDRAKQLGAIDFIIKSQTIPQEMAAKVKAYVENGTTEQSSALNRQL